MVQGYGRSKHDPKYGKGEHFIAIDEAELLDETEMTARIVAAFERPDYRPPTLPSVALELVELSRKPEVEIDAVVSLLERDAMLAGNVLRIAQSPIYAGTARIQSLRDALMRVGLRALRDLVLQVAMNLRVFRAPAYADSMERVGRHSLATAHLARIVCKYTAIEGEYAFLCGLLHDVGIAGTLIALGDVPRGAAVPDLTALWPAIDGAHARASAQMARLWKLPAEIPLVLAAHHDVTIDGFEHPLAATVCIADRLAHELGFGLAASEKEATEGELEALATLSAASGADHSTPRALERARAALRLEDAVLKLIRAEAESVLRAHLGGGDPDPES